MPATFDVTVNEYRFDYRGRVPSGRVVFRTRNAGAIAHEVLLVAVPDDFHLSVSEQVKSPTPAAFPTKAIVPERGPQSTGEFAVDMTPGRYALVCFLRDPDGVYHARKGMTAEFTVG